MEPTTIMAIMSVIFAIVGFFTDMFFGLSTRKLYVDGGTLLLTATISFLLTGSFIKAPQVQLMERLFTFITIFIIPMIIGDSAGTFVSNLIKSTR